MCVEGEGVVTKHNLKHWDLGAGRGGVLVGVGTPMRVMGPV